MGELNRHWTERSVDDFLFRIASDYVRQIEQMMDESGISQTTVAKKLGVSAGRVSQVLNNPGNLTLKKIIEYARAIRKKVAIVAYDDGDPANEKGPINSQVFVSCWERAGKPADFFELSKQRTTFSSADTGRDYRIARFVPGTQRYLMLTVPQGSNLEHLHLRGTAGSSWEIETSNERYEERDLLWQNQIR